jgi:hypothetical protein
LSFAKTVIAENRHCHGTNERTPVGPIPYGKQGCALRASE